MESGSEDSHACAKHPSALGGPMNEAEGKSVS